MAGEGTLGEIKTEMDECSRLVDRARFEWALGHHDHARDAAVRARDGLIGFLHCLTMPQFADYELDLFRWHAGQLDRAITAIEQSLTALCQPKSSAAAAD
jgi:hypothetical protein